jgi:chemotaxis protein methyltransferase WspC
MDRLAEARRLADSGALAPAIAACLAELQQAGPSADAYSLLGILRQAAHEEDEAGRCFQKALYLDPDHEEALEHLLLWCQARGDQAQAERLRQRLARVRQRGMP